MLWNPKVLKVNELVVLIYTFLQKIGERRRERIHLLRSTS